MSSFVCPRDGHPLSDGEIHAAPYHRCSHCHGLLLVEDDFESLRVRLKRGARQPVSKEGRGRVRIIEGSARCRCGQLMTAVERTATDGEQVTVDVCENCRSIWLDGGELARLVKRRPSFAPMGEAVTEGAGWAIAESLGAAFDVLEVVASIFSW